MTLRCASTFLLAATLVTATGAQRAQAEPVPFASRQTIVSGVTTSSEVRTPDLDGDGDLDLVIAFTGGGTGFAWYRNTDGAGTFALAQTLTTTITVSQDVEAADLDGDGDLDLVATGSAADLVVWFENTNGAGSFGSAQTVSTEHDGPIGVVTADFDRDGDVDLAVCSTADDEFAWFENTNGAGSFSRHLVTSSLPSCRPLAVGDMDRDGDLDVAQGKFSELTWFTNRLEEISDDFDGPFQVFDVNEAPHSLATADVDGDGDPDLLMGSQGGMLAWYPNSNATFGVQIPLKTGVPNGDFSVGDLDADGDLDLVSFVEGTNIVEWHENTAGDGSAWTIRSVGTDSDWPMEAHLADLDGDGDLDVVVASVTDGIVGWYENRRIHRKARYPARLQVASMAMQSLPAIGDIDRDGDLDLVVGEAATEQVRWFENTAGDGSVWSAHVIGAGGLDPAQISLADVDADGDLDAVVALLNAGVGWYANLSGDGSSWGAYQEFGLGSGLTVVTADFDRDGDVDAVGARSAFSYHFSNDGGGASFTGTALPNDVTSPRSTDAGDMDGDGDADVLIAGTDTTTPVIWYENRLEVPAAWLLHTISGSVDNSADVVRAGDLDGDGDLDVVTSASNNDALAWHENDGSGTSWTRSVIEVQTFCSDAVAVDVVLADLDADGDLDIAMTSWNGNSLVGACSQVRWYENTAGDGSNWTVHAGIPGNPTVARGIAAADLDRNGTLDLVTGNGASQANWLNINFDRGGQFGLVTASTAPAWIFQGQADDVLEIEVVHNGRAGDSSLELATLELLFESWPGFPLESLVANSIFDVLEVYADDGSGVFESGTDPLVASVGTLSLTSGVQTVTFVDGAPGVTVAAAASRTYFVVPRLTEDAASHASTFLITHLAASSSTAEDAAYDLPLSLEISNDSSSGTVHVFGGSSDSDGDGLSDTDEVNVYGSDPFDSDSDDDGFLDGYEPTIGTSPSNSDSDADGFCDGPLAPGACTPGDNCPAIANAPQTNSDAAPAGDPCQCGDVGGAIGIGPSDLMALRENVVGRTPGGGAFDLDHCDVNADDACDVEDVFVLERFVAGVEDLIANGCAGYSTP